MDWTRLDYYHPDTNGGPLSETQLRSSFDFDEELFGADDSEDRWLRHDGAPCAADPVLLGQPVDPHVRCSGQYTAPRAEAEAAADEQLEVTGLSRRVACVAGLITAVLLSVLLLLSLVAPSTLPDQTRTTIETATAKGQRGLLHANGSYTFFQVRLSRAKGAALYS